MYCCLVRNEWMGLESRVLRNFPYVQLWYKNTVSILKMLSKAADMRGFSAAVDSSEAQNGRKTLSLRQPIVMAHSASRLMAVSNIRCTLSRNR